MANYKNPQWNNNALPALNAENLNALCNEVEELSSAMPNKQATITGAATTITGSNLTASRALVSDGNGKVGVSAVTATELGYLDGVTSSVQTQLNAKQASVTGAATTITGSNLTTNRALISNGSGKVAVSAVTSTELGYLSGATSNVQTQINNKYTKPSSGIPKTDLASAVQTSLGKADSAVLYTSQSLTDTQKDQTCENAGASRCLHSNVTLYVSASGSDTTGDGSESKPFRQVQRAIDTLPKNLAEYGVIINVGAGNFEPFTLTGFYGSGGHGESYGAIMIIGEGTGSTFFSYSGSAWVDGTIYIYNCNCCIYLRDLTVSVTSSVNIGYGALAAYGKNLNVLTNRVVANGNSTTVAALITAMNAYLHTLTANNGTVGIWVDACANAHMYGCGGSGNTIGVRAGSPSSGAASIFTISGGVPAGTTQYEKCFGSVIFRNGSLV